MLPRVLKDVFHESKSSKIPRSRDCLIWCYFRVWTLNYLCSLHAWRGRNMSTLFFRSLLRCMQSFKAVLSMIAFGLWTRIMVGRCSLLADAISHAQQSCRGSSQPLTSPKAIGSQFWLPQEIWLGCWWHTQTELVLEQNTPQTIPGTLILCLESDIPLAIFSSLFPSFTFSSASP